MSIKFDPTSPTCPSCDQPKVDSTNKDMNGRPLCYYCYHRSRNGTVKMLILFILSEQNKGIPVLELIELMNNHPINNGKKDFKYVTIHSHLQRLAHKSNRLITKRNIKDGRRARPFIKARITPLGRKRLKVWLQLWDEGMFVRANLTVKERSKMMRPENKNKHLAIAKKIKNGECGRWDFIFGETLKQERFHIKKGEN